MSLAVSVPIFSPESCVRMTQSCTKILAQGPKSLVFRVVLITMASSPHVRSQSRISTSRQWSGSMPSQLGTSSRLCTVTWSTRTWRQPSRCRPQNGASPKVMSRTTRFVQPVRTNIFGRHGWNSHHSPGRIVSGHEGQRTSADAAGAGDAQVRRVAGGEDAVSAVIRPVGAEEQFAAAR